MSTARTRPQPDVEAQVADIRRRLAEATRARVRAEADRDAAQATAEAARRQLADEFGVSSVAEATAMLSALESDLAVQLDALHAALDEIGM